MHHVSFTVVMATLLVYCSNALSYDPLKVAEGLHLPAPVDLTTTDTARKREIPVRIFLPADGKPAPVVLFSHGLGGSREGSDYLGKHWAARGYVAVYMQHHGSDDAVWKDAPKNERGKAMNAAANLLNFMDRVQDVSATLDALEGWSHAKDSQLSGRLDLTHVGMSGHSFGAVTTQAVSGQTTSTGRSLSDARIRAAVAFSPSPPKLGDPASAFGSVKLPWLLMTGTKDTSPIGNTSAAARLQVFKALPPGDKYECVLDKAEHSAFTDRPLPGDKEPRNPNHHRVILALTTAFWDAYLRNDTGAKEWLQGEEPRKIMEAGDLWEKK